MSVLKQADLFGVYKQRFRPPLKASSFSDPMWGEPLGSYLLFGCLLAKCLPYSFPGGGGGGGAIPSQEAAESRAFTVQKSYRTHSHVTSSMQPCEGVC